MNWANDDIVRVIDHTITEYDIKSGNTSILRAYPEIFDPPVPIEEIERLESMEKQVRVVAVGLMAKRRKGFAKSMEDGFNRAVKTFLQQNHLMDDEYGHPNEIGDRVIDIKRDAVFVIGNPVPQTMVGDYVNFRPKNVYRGYFRIRRYEFFYDPDSNKVDVKGLDDSLLPKHENGILELIRTLYQGLLESPGRRDVMSRWMAEFAQAYLDKELDFEYYREFNSSSQFKVNMGGQVFEMDAIHEDDLPYLDITYNYVNIIVPLINVIL